MEQIQQQQDAGKPEANHGHNAVEFRPAISAMDTALHKRKSEKDAHLKTDPDR